MSVKRLNQRGDTIVEVLIALAILSFTLTTCYSIVNRSLIAARSAQEHSEALEYLNSQVELTRSIASNPDLFKQKEKDAFCMNSAAEMVPDTDPACTVGIEGFYKLQINRTEPAGIKQDVFTFVVTWPGPGQLGEQREELNYKLYEVEKP